MNLARPPASIAIAVLCWAAAAAAAERPTQCGGLVRRIGAGDVELVVRARQIEVRVRDETGAPLNVTASASFATAQGAVRIPLQHAAPGLMVGEAGENIRARSIMLHLAFADGVSGQARFPVRRATCAPAAASGER